MDDNTIYFVGVTNISSGNSATLEEVKGIVDLWYLNPELVEDVDRGFFHMPLADTYREKIENDCYLEEVINYGDNLFMLNAEIP